jgi:hypothetical protein
MSFFGCMLYHKFRRLSHFAFGVPKPSTFLFPDSGYYSLNNTFMVDLLPSVLSSLALVGLAVYTLSVVALLVSPVSRSAAWLLLCVLGCLLVSVWSVCHHQLVVCNSQSCTKNTWYKQQTIKALWQDNGNKSTIGNFVGMLT